MLYRSGGSAAHPEQPASTEELINVKRAVGRDRDGPPRARAAPRTNRRPRRADRLHTHRARLADDDAHGEGAPLRLRGSREAGSQDERDDSKADG